jgi:membrane protein DedA with SNARE-associated domain
MLEVWNFLWFDGVIDCMEQVLAAVFLGAIVGFYVWFYATQKPQPFYQASDVAQEERVVAWIAGVRAGAAGNLMFHMQAARIAAKRFHRLHGRRATMNDVEKVSELFSLMDKS